jgi:hypothetical protein
MFYFYLDVSLAPHSVPTQFSCVVVMVIPSDARKDSSELRKTQRGTEDKDEQFLSWELHGCNELSHTLVSFITSGRGDIIIIIKFKSLLFAC